MKFGNELQNLIKKHMKLGKSVAEIVGNMEGTKYLLYSGAMDRAEREVNKEGYKEFEKLMKELASTFGTNK